MADSDLGVKVRCVPELNAAEFQAKVDSMKLKVKVSADFTGFSESTKAIATTSQSLSKMYDKLAKLRKNQLVDKSSVTNAERQLDLLQQMPRYSQQYAKQMASAQKAVQRAISNNQNSTSLKKIQSLSQQVSAWASKVNNKRQFSIVDKESLGQFDALYQKVQSLTVGTQQWLSAVNALRPAYTKLMQSSKTMADASKQASTQRKMSDNLAAWEAEMRRIVRYNPKANQSGFQNFNSYASQFREAQTLEEQTRLYNEAVQARRRYMEAVRSQARLEVEAARTTARATNLSNLRSQISDFVRNTPKIRSNQTIYQQLVGLQNRAAQPDADFAALQNRFSNLRSQIKVLGLDTESLGQRLGRLFKDHMNTAIAMAGLHLIQSAFRELYQSVLDVDTAMTNLKKVSSGTAQEYTNFLDSASNRAHDLGSTVSDVIDATSEFSRLGYNLEESTDLADAALMYKNVSEYTNVSDAAQSIVSTMKAFDIEADNVQGIVDKFNEIGNNYAISSEGLGEAMQRSAASLALAGNSLDESLALVTGANEIVQDPDVVGKYVPSCMVTCRLVNGYIG